MALLTNDHAGMVQLQLVEEVQSSSRQYAHRQIKWARGVELFQWLDAEQPESQIVAQILCSINDPPYTGAAAHHHACTRCLFSVCFKDLWVYGYCKRRVFTITVQETAKAEACWTHWGRRRCGAISHT